MSDLPSGWETAEALDVCRAGEPAIMTGPFGSNLGREDFVSSGVPVFTIGCLGRDFIDRDKLSFVSKTKAAALAAYRLLEGDLLFSRMADVGRVGFVPADLEGAIYNYHLMRIRLDTRVIEPRYFYLYVRGAERVQAYLEDVNRGATRDGINTKLLSSLPVSVPPLAEQRRIVAKLDQVMARTARARAELDRIPTLIAHHKRAILAAEIEAASIGSVETTLEELLDVLTSGSRDWAQYYDRGTGVFVLAGNVKPMAFDPNPRRFVDPPRDGPDAKRSRVAQDDILLTIVGAGTGELCRVGEAVDDYFVCQSVALLRPKEAHLSQWLELFLNSEMHGKGQIQELIYGQGRPHLGFDDIRAIVVRIPSSEAISSAVHRIQRAFAWLDKVAQEHVQATRLLDHLDQALLAKAFRGELVPQNPADEPAATLLARIRAEREGAAPATRKRKARA